MKEEISVLIVDDNVEYGELLKEYLCQESDISVAGIATDGIQAIEMIKTLKPDITVLDIVMPNLDGIGVLEKISALKLEKRTSFIVLSAIGQDLFIQNALELGAEYYLIKPFDVNVLILRIRQIYKERHNNVYFKKRGIPQSISPMAAIKRNEPEITLELKVTNLMREIGVPPHVPGYQYIREAVIHMLNSSKRFDSITKVIYPEIARKFCTTSNKVERAIRSAIETTWKKGNHDSIDALFGYTINYSKGKPTNTEFLAMIVDRIKITSR